MGKIWGERRASVDGSVRAIFLGGKSRGSVAFGTRVFLAGNHISNEQRDKGPVKLRELNGARDKPHIYNG